MGRKGQTRNWLIIASLSTGEYDFPKFITMAMLNDGMSDRKTYNSFMPTDMLSLPFAVGRTAFDFGLLASVSLARMTQIAMQSADTALAKYIELTEQEIRRSQRKESVKVE